MVSNRTAQRVLAHGKRQKIYRISNRKIMMHGENYPAHIYVITKKLSRSQARANRRKAMHERATFLLAAPKGDSDEA